MMSHRMECMMKHMTSYRMECISTARQHTHDCPCDTESSNPRRTTSDKRCIVRENVGCGDESNIRYTSQGHTYARLRDKLLRRASRGKLDSSPRFAAATFCGR